jgi:hypothetical protein
MATTTGYHDTPENAAKMVGRRIEIKHHGATAHGRVRHPIFLRIRDDLEAAS